MLLEADLIEIHAAKKFIQLQQRRIASKEKTKIVWPLNVTIADNATHNRLHRTVINLLNNDVDIVDDAMAHKFPVVVYIELITPARFILLIKLTKICILIVFVIFLLHFITSYLVPALLSTTNL